MSAVRQRDTEPELSVRRALHAKGIRGWRCNFRGAPGRPDLAWPALRVAVFIDGAFWHGHPSRHRPGRSGRYWDEKIAGNIARDRRVDADLVGHGWEVVRIWDFEVRRDLEAVLDRVVAALVSRLRLDESAPVWQRRLTPGGTQ
jgi:DNA mismatch endonuclease (patch repair protein)